MVFTTTRIASIFVSSTAVHIYDFRIFTAIIRMNILNTRITYTYVLLLFITLALLRLTFCCRTEKKVILKRRPTLIVISKLLNHGQRGGAMMLWWGRSPPSPEAWVRIWTWSYMCTRVEFVVGSGPDYGGFSPAPLVFFPSQKPTL